MERLCASSGATVAGFRREEVFFGSSGRLSLTCSEHEDVISCDVCSDNCEVVDPTRPIDLPSVRVSDV